MRRVWPAIGVGALTLACGRPNPGFKLIDTSDVGGSEGQSGSLEPTDSGPATATATTTPTSTDGSGSMTASDGTVSAGTSEPSSTSMAAGHWEFPVDCGDDYLESEYTDAAADTFFLNEIAVNHCSFLPFEEEVPDCQNMQFSLSSVFQLFLKADQNSPLGDYVGIYGVRYAQPTPMHDGDIPIPEAAFLAVEARIHMFRPFPPAEWVGLKLNVRRFAPGDTWTATEGYDFTPCTAPEASFRCRTCPADGEPYEAACTQDWGMPGLPYHPDIKPIHVVNFINPPDADFGADLQLLFTKDDLGWLTTEGLLVMPAIDTVYDTIEVKTLESGMPEWYPGLRVRYCEPYFVPD